MRRAIFPTKRQAIVTIRGRLDLRRRFSEIHMAQHLLLLATLMVLAYGYSRKRAFTNFGQC